MTLVDIRIPAVSIGGAADDDRDDHLGARTAFAIHSARFFFLIEGERNRRHHRHHRHKLIRTKASAVPAP
jgi:hypothetical protein